MTDEMTPEQIRAAQAEAEKNEALLLQVIQCETIEERQSAAREIGIMPPEKVGLETRVVLRIVRTQEGKWWGAVEGKTGVVSQMITDEAGDMIATLAGAAALTCCPLMTDEEHAAYKALIENPA